MEKEKVPDEIMYQLKTWRLEARILRVLHVLLGLVAIVSSVTVASRVIENAATMSWIAWLAAIASAVLTSLGLESKSNNMRSAWRILNTAVLRYQTEGEDFTIKQLNDAYKIAEGVIGDVTVTLSK